MWHRFLMSLLLLVVIIGVGIYTMPDTRLHIVFCDVGQGDAILLTRGLWQMLVDSGPDASVLKCIERHVPFYDRTIEVALSTHPELDHAGGFVDVMQRYTLKYFFINPEANTTKSYARLVELIHSKGIVPRNLFAFQSIHSNGVEFETIWPRREYVADHVSAPGGEFQQVLGLATDGKNLNSFAIVGEVVFGKFNLLLTGDADQAVEEAQMATGLLNTVEVLKVPHHGSKTGMTTEWLAQLNPELAVISVGKKNRYGHPHSYTLDLLKIQGAAVKRTDLSGSIEIVTDGTEWWIAGEKRKFSGEALQ